MLPIKNIPRHAVFFDIETTGLSWRTSHLYLIGCAYEEDDRWVLQQWFLDRPGEEKKLLETFADFLRERTAPRTAHSANDPSGLLLVHYNGSTFDLPYLRHKYAFYGLADPFRDLTDCTGSDTQPEPGTALSGLDLYRTARRFRHLLQTDTLKQRDLERCLGIPRDDAHTGGDLISVYESYLRSGDANLLDALCLHNFEDVRNLLPLWQLQAYEALSAGAFAVTDLAFPDPGDHLQITLTLRLPLPAPLSRTLQMTESGPASSCVLRAEQCHAALTIPVHADALRHFFPDYKNYYYLPDEDMAIHKSVGAYVDSAHRRRATADTCYQRADGPFLPQVTERFVPVFRRMRTDPVSWFRIADAGLREGSPALHAYAAELVQALLNLN